LSDAGSDRTSGEQRGAGRGSGAALLVSMAALAGAGTMVVELGAVRLIAPWFGASSVVWTNVIGVVLAALALGYAVGARLAACEAPMGRFGAVLLLAGAFAAWLPLAAAPVAEVFMPEGVALHAAADALVWGSLAASLVLFLPAAVALGAAGPLAVEALQRIRGGGAGASGGRVLAASTLGSLAGAFGTTHLLVPVLGVEASFVAAAATLGVAGAVVIARSRASLRAAAVFGAALALGIGADAVSPDALARPAGAGERLLTSAESSIQSLRVVEVGQGESVTRLLRVNESLDSFQSVWTPTPGLLPRGHYYNHFALPYAWRTREAGAPPTTWRVLVLGLGAGSAVRVLEGVADARTELTVTGVELDPVVLELAREHFDLAPAGAPGRDFVGGLDGRAALGLLEGPFDEIIVDAYANNMEIPPHLATVEAFAEARAALAEGGWLAINVGGFGPDDPVLRAVGATAARAFADDGGAFAARVPFSRNWVVLARKGGDVPTPGTSSFGARGARLVGGTDRLVRELEVEDAWLVFPAGEGTPLTDDHSPTEALQVASIRAARSRLGRLEDAAEVLGAAPVDPVPGSADPRDASTASAARALQSDGDHVGALAAAAEIEDPGARTALRGELLWGAGAPFEALEALLADPEVARDSIAVLRLAADLGAVVDAGAVAVAATDRLRATVEARAPAMSPELRAWWGSEVERLAAQSGTSAAAVAARSAAVARARWTVLAATAAAALVAACALSGGPSGVFPSQA